jgi:cation diffusion facilitator CzcD-associated flavoprotein CzcO
MAHDTNGSPHLAILGSGPIGLEAALAAAERGWRFTVYEAGAAPAANVRSWGHVRLFSPWLLDASPRMRRALAAAGRTVPDDAAICPTGADLVREVLDPVAGLPAVAPHLRTGARVLAVGREGLLKNEEIASPERRRRRFRLLVDQRDGGGERVEYADAVIDATGLLEHPNALGDGGIPAPGERELAGDLRRTVPDFGAEASDWAGRRILLVGSGHSAQTAARDLAALAESTPGTSFVWLLRRVPEWVLDHEDPLPERARLAAAAQALATGASAAVEVRIGATVEGLERTGGAITVTLRLASGSLERLAVDRVLSLTGSVGDSALYRQLQVHECYASGAPMKLSAALLGASASGGDCMSQTGFGPETLTNPEPRFFILGAKSYGRNPAFLMRIGWEQVEDVFGLLAGQL